MVTTAGSTATATLEWEDRPPIKPVASVKQILSIPKQVQEDLVVVQDHTQLFPNQVQEDPPTLQAGTTQMVKHTTVAGMQMVTTAGSTATATLEWEDRPPIKPVASVRQILSIP